MNARADLQVLVREQAEYHPEAVGSGDRWDAAAAALAELIDQNKVMRQALTRLSKSPGCGCSHPCRCDGPEWCRIEIEGRMDVAAEALARADGAA